MSLSLDSTRAQTEIRSLLQRHRHGPHDPTMSLSDTDFWRAVRTPAGPTTLHLRLGTEDPAAEAFGPGAEWVLATVPDLLGRNDILPDLDTPHPAVAKALHRHGTPRTSASLMLLDETIFNILGQRVTTIEAMKQWSSLCRHTSETAPGPVALILPPDPAALAATPGWKYHRMGIERSRADTIVNACRRAGRVHEVATMTIADGYRRLMAFPGVGIWTAASAMWTAMGDADAVPVGDFHVKNVVSFALAGEPRGTDERMLDLLAPYAGHRGRVLQALTNDGWTAPRYGPRHEIKSIASW